MRLLASLPLNFYHMERKQTSVQLPHLPTEIISNIINHCEISSYFTFTHVNTVFRQFVYEQIDYLLSSQSQNRSTTFSPQIPHDLAIHLLNNQRPSVAAITSTRETFIFHFTREDGRNFTNDNEQDEVDRGRMYAPVFTLSDYKPFLEPSFVKRTLIMATDDWFGSVEGSGNEDIDMVRRDRMFHKDTERNRMARARGLTKRRRKRVQE